MFINQGELIKHHREQRGMTQSQLAEGICSRHSIVKAEAGERKLSEFLFRDVLLKLGLNPNDFMPAAYDNDTLFFLQIEEQLNKFDYSAGKERIKKTKADIDNYLATNQATTMWQSLVLQAEYNIYLPSTDDGTRPDMVMDDILKARDCAIQIIKLFRPEFELENIDSYYLTLREQKWLNNISITYAYADEPLQELAILKKLLSNLENSHKGFLESDVYRSRYLPLLLNIGMSYKDMEMWEECLAHFQQCLSVLLNIGELRRYIIALDNMAKALMQLGRIDEGNACYRRLLMFLHGMGSEYESMNIPTTIESLKANYEKDFGGRLEV